MENKILGFWIIVMVAAATVTAMSFAMLIGFILGGMITMGAGAVVSSYSLLVDCRARDETGKIPASHGGHEKLN
jgi:hypothetical protein